MNKIENIENQTKNPHFQIIVDIAIILLISVCALSIYNDYWLFEHASKKNLLAIHFDMFSFYYLLVFALFMCVVPNALEFFSGRSFLHKYTSERQLPAKLVRVLKIIITTAIIVLCSVMFSDNYSRVEFYDNGIIVEYNKDNQIVNEYSKGDIDVVELKADYGRSGRHVYYKAVANIYINDSYYTLNQGNYIAPDNFAVNPETERNLYGLKKVKEIFSDKIKINTENLDILFEVERYDYTKSQAKELCDIFEVDYNEMMLWLEEEWGIVLEEDV